MFVSITRRLTLCSVVSLLSSVIITGCSDTQSVKPEVTNVNDGGDAEGLALPTGAEIEDAAGEAVDAVSQQAKAAWEKASSAMKDLEGGREMLDGMKDLYSSAKTSVQGVANEEAALKAKAELDQLSEKIETWKPKLAEMSKDAKVAAKRLLDHISQQLESFVQQLENNEWVQNILKPKLKEIAEQLKSLV